MGSNSTATMAIVRVESRSIAKMITEGSREFCSVLESTSVCAAGVIIPPFIVWQGRTHREYLIIAMALFQGY